MTNALCLNTITIKQEPDIRRQIEITAEAGYDGIGLWDNALAEFETAGGNLRDLGEFVAAQGLFVPEALFVRGWMLISSEERRGALEAARDAFRRAYLVGSQTVVCCAAGHAGDENQAVQDWRDLCDVAEEFGIRLALEFIGMAAQFKDLDSVYRIVSKADIKVGGILVDTFHFHRGASSLDSLAGNVPVKAIAMVHVNDFLPKPREVLTDLDRVFPGDGGGELFPILRALKENDYSGPLSLEIFNQDYWSRDPREVAKEGLDKLRKFIAGI